MGTLRWIGVQEKNSWDLSEEEKVAEAGAAKERGNVKFKAGLWRSAIKRYEKATKLIDFDKNFKEENVSKSTEIKRSCNLNLAAAQLKLGDFKKAIDACNQVWLCIGSIGLEYSLASECRIEAPQPLCFTESCEKAG